MHMSYQFQVAFWVLYTPVGLRSDSEGYPFMCLILTYSVILKSKQSPYTNRAQLSFELIDYWCLDFFLCSQQICQFYS